MGPGVMEGGVGAKAEYICCCGAWLARWRAWAAAAAATHTHTHTLIETQYNDTQCYGARFENKAGHLTCCCLRVLWMLHWAGSRVVRRTPVLWGTALLALACRRGRGLGVLWVGVQGGAGVGVLLRHWPWRHCETGVRFKHLRGKNLRYSLKIKC